MSLGGGETRCKEYALFARVVDPLWMVHASGSGGETRESEPGLELALGVITRLGGERMREMAGLSTRNSESDKWAVLGSARFRFEIVLTA